MGGYEPGEFLPEDQQEDLEDLGLDANWSAGPTLWSTDWTTETVVGQLRRGNINLNPRFQRRNAWSGVRKSLFIESLILGLPIPQIILAEEKGKKGSFIVIDGKQRLLTLRQFLSDDSDTDFLQLKLTGLSDRPDLNGSTYLKLKSDPNLQEELNNFENQTVRTVVIRGWKSEKYLYSVFLRINTGSVQLSTQELRQALHPGQFSNFIDDFSVGSDLLKSILRLKEPDFRMRDVEIVLRYFSYRNFLSEYSGDLKKFLDDTTKYFNDTWQTQEQKLKTQTEDFENALTTTRKIFGERNELRKWNGSQYEKRINRAVFDIMVFYFSEKSIRDAALSKADKVKEAFEKLCEEDRDFLTAIELTTKSTAANKNRFSIWAAELTRILQFPVASPLT
jgi:hypothetical protein